MPRPAPYGSADPIGRGPLRTVANTLVVVATLLWVGIIIGVVIHIAVK